jgi:hypothetical protein
MPDIGTLPNPGQKPWNLNEAIELINAAVDAVMTALLGGDATQVLSKLSSDDFDFEWIDAPSFTDYRGHYVGINAQTGTTYAPVLADIGKLVTLDNAGAITVTLPQDSDVAFPIATRVDFLGINTGLVTFAAGTGATVNGTPSLVSRARWSAVTAVKRAANTWVVIGDLA